MNEDKIDGLVANQRLGLRHDRGMILHMPLLGEARFVIPSPA